MPRLVSLLKYWNCSSEIQDGLETASRELHNIRHKCRLTCLLAQGEYLSAKSLSIFNLKWSNFAHSYLCFFLKCEPRRMTRYLWDSMFCNWWAYVPSTAIYRLNFSSCTLRYFLCTILPLSLAAAFFHKPHLILDFAPGDSLSFSRKLEPWTLH